MFDKYNICRTFLICSNILLMAVGLTIIILGIKMHFALTMLFLINIPIVMQFVNAIIATGVFISLSAVLGMTGSFNESKPMLVGHLTSLGVLTIMEFSLGVTLMFIKNKVSAAVESPHCNNVCAASIDAAILNYALPSAGLMASVFFVEALMIYSSIRLYFFIRDRQQMSMVTEPSIGVQNVQMQNVAGSQSPFVTSPTIYSSQLEHTPHQAGLQPSDYAAMTFRRSQPYIEDEPPDYNSLVQQPPLYFEQVSPGVPGTRASVEPKDMEETFNQV